MKPGWQTTELWFPIATTLLAAMVFLGYVDSKDQGELAGRLESAIKHSAAAVTEIAAVVAYLKGRTALKLAELERPADPRPAPRYTRIQVPAPEQSDPV
jgi:hypothetical protein